MKGLEGVRVLDFSRVLAGPGCTAFLALLGAEVIRVGTKTKADYRDAQGKLPTVVNQNKLSCTINMKSAEGRTVAKQLAVRSDIVIENFSKGVVERWGMDHSTLAQENPGVSMISISGMGRTGPESAAVAYGSLLQGYTGWCSLIPGVKLEPGDTGLGVSPAWTDRVTAVMATIAATATIAETRATGKGLHVDLSMIDSLNSLLVGAVDEWLDLSDGVDVAPVPHGCFRAGGNTWVAVACYTDTQWLRLVRMIGEEDWAVLSDRSDRRSVEPEINRWLAQWIARQDGVAVAKQLSEAGVPAACSSSVWDLVADPVIAERGYYNGGKKRDQPYTLALPWLFPDGSRGAIKPSSALGQDTNAVLNKVLGLSETEIAELRSSGALD